MLTWGQFAQQNPELAVACRKAIYQHGPDYSVGFLSKPLEEWNSISQAAFQFIHEGHLYAVIFHQSSNLFEPKHNEVHLFGTLISPADGRFSGVGRCELITDSRLINQLAEYANLKLDNNVMIYEFLLISVWYTPKDSNQPGTNSTTTIWELNDDDT